MISRNKQMTIRKGLISVDTNYLIGNYNIKRDLLYFDKLVYDKDELKISEMIVDPIGKVFLKGQDYKKIVKSKIADLNFLQDKGVLETITSTDLERTVIKNNVSGFKEYFEKNKGTAFFSATETITMGSIFYATMIQSDGPPLHPLSIYKSNFITLLNKAVTGEELTPIYSDRLVGNNETEGKEYKVLQVVLNKISIPEDNVSLEQIIDLKTDEELKRKFLALRNWMIDISKADFNSKEIEEKLNHLYNEYENGMKYHKMKTGLGSFKLVIITTAEVLENLVTLKWSTAAKTVFDIFDSQTKLAELEMNTAGRELAFIHAINDRLKKWNNN